MKKILFIDTVCPKPYDPYTLETEGLGGSEASVVRIAEALAVDHYVEVMQHNRQESNIDFKACYMPISDEHLKFQWDAIVVLRSPFTLDFIKKMRPDARLFLWAHDLAGPWLGQNVGTLEKTKPVVIAVSNFHKTDMQEYLKGREGYVPLMRVIPNPVDDELHPVTSEVDKNKLMFFSSPHKGLGYATAMFTIIRRTLPQLKLYIANPGYFPDHTTKGRDNIVSLGALPHKHVMDHVANSLAVFYPNWQFPETFGLVYAESNAVGTPVLTHDLGAARQVLTDHRQLVDCKKISVMVETIKKWQEERPWVFCKDEFRTSNVVKEWEKLLEV